MTRHALGIAVLAVSLCSSGGPIAGQPPVPSDPSGIVIVEVRAEKPDGASAVGLGREDFEVTSDGEACPIESFSAEHRPATVVALFDVSASCPLQPKLLKAAVEKHLIPSLRSGDRARFGTIGGRELVLNPQFSGGRKELLAAARILNLPDAFVIGSGGTPSSRASVFTSSGFKTSGRLPAVRLGPSPVWDGVFAAIAALQPEPGCRAIILLTDGRSTGNVYGLDEVIDRAMRAGVSINVISEGAETLIPLNQTTAARVRPDVLLQAMADATGGAHVSALDALAAARDREPVDVVGALMTRLVVQLHESCVLGFSAPQLDGKWHRLEVRARVPGVIVRARKGYLAGPTGSSG